TGAAAPATAAAISSTRSVGWVPRKQSVTWSAPAGIGRTPPGTPPSPATARRPHPAISARASPGRSAATNSRAPPGLIPAPGGRPSPRSDAALPAEQPPEEVHRVGRRPVADVGPPAPEVEAPGQAPLHRPPRVPGGH